MKERNDAELGSINPEDVANRSSANRTHSRLRRLTSDGAFVTKAKVAASDQSAIDLLIETHSALLLIL